MGETTILHVIRSPLAGPVHGPSARSGTLTSIAGHAALARPQPGRLVAAQRPGQPRRPRPVMSGRPWFAADSAHRVRFVSGFVRMRVHLRLGLWLSGARSAPCLGGRRRIPFEFLAGLDVRVLGDALLVTNGTSEPAEGSSPGRPQSPKISRPRALGASEGRVSRLLRIYVDHADGSSVDQGSQLCRYLTDEVARRCTCRLRPGAALPLSAHGIEPRPEGNRQRIERRIPTGLARLPACRAPGCVLSTTLEFFRRRRHVPPPRSPAASSGSS